MGGGGLILASLSETPAVGTLISDIYIRAESVSFHCIHVASRKCHLLWACESSPVVEFPVDFDVLFYLH